MNAAWVGMPNSKAAKKLPKIDAPVRKEAKKKEATEEGRDPQCQEGQQSS